MKKIFFGAIVIFCVFIITAFSFYQNSVEGAWHMKKGNTEGVLIYMDGYFSHTMFDRVNKKFIYSTGGTYTTKNGKLNYKVEFDTKDKDAIGSEQILAFEFKDDKLIIAGNTENKLELTRLDDGTGALAGNWRISGRMNNGTMQPVQRSARKTLKLLSGTRFQWMAINAETKEFFGTGGGIYTFIDGNYTENIEFFSRDSSRVGASLSFEGSVSGDVWTHKGLNSRGEPLHEEWSREK